jgi:hypothetical protein
MIEKSKTESKPIIFYVIQMKVTDKIVKELFSHSKFFSKTVLETLKYTREIIQDKMSATDEKLESILFENN